MRAPAQFSGPMPPNIGRASETHIEPISMSADSTTTGKRQNEATVLRHRAVEALHAIARKLQGRPFCEIAHWGGEQTVTLLNGMMRLVIDAPARTVQTYRCDARRECVNLMWLPITTRDAENVILRLLWSAVQDMLGNRLSSAYDAPVREQLHRWTQGQAGWFCRTVFGQDVLQVAARLTAHVEQLLDPQALCYARQLKVTTPSFMSWLFTCIWQDHAIGEILRHVPALSPIYTDLTHNRQARLEGAVQDVVHALKARLRAAGLTESAWRYLLTLPLDAVAAIEWPGGNEVRRALILNTLAATGARCTVPSIVRHAALLIERLAEPQHHELRGFARDSAYLAFIRAFVRRAMQERDAATHERLYQESLDILDWVRAEVAETSLDHNQRHAPFAWWKRRSDAWHRVVDQLQHARDLHWASLLELAVIDGYTVIPLTSAAALVEEGREMRHCVATYAERCKCGTSRVFSIRRDERRVATLELGYREQWRVLQMRGPCNAAVDQDLNRIGEETARRYQALWEARWRG